MSFSSFHNKDEILAKILQSTKTIALVGASQVCCLFSGSGLHVEIAASTFVPLFSSFDHLRVSILENENF